ncbi:hypothetical protein [Microbacterium sp.]|uniref:hypothetical protein n=1 Tax=Microbacterium sp. TaxID=51671 RepID=UPI0037CABECF
MTEESRPASPTTVVRWVLRGALQLISGVIGLLVVILAVTMAQGLFVRGRLVRTRLDDVDAFSGTVAAGNEGPPLSLGVMGDSLAVGYGAESLAAASVILPSVRVAAGAPLPEDADVRHRVYRKGSHHPLAWWAFRASRRAGMRLTAHSSAVDRSVAPAADPRAPERPAAASLDR